MSEVVQDFRYGLRVLLKAPGASAVAILALGLGIGANSAIFSVMNAILIRPLPYQDPDRLVAVFENKLDKGMRRQAVSPLDYKNYAEQSQVFDGIGALQPDFHFTGGELPERIEGAAISPAIFQFLGLRPALGGPFAADEDQPQKNSVAVLSDGLWRRRFGGDAGILGSQIVLDGKAYSVIGIAPRGFHLVDSPSEIWVPYTPNPVELTPFWQGLRTLRVLAHLRPGVSARQAETAMQAIARRLAQENPNSNAGYGAEVIPLREQVLGNIGATLWMLTSAVAFVLLIACANVANCLARAGAPEKEIAVRSSLGANPARIVRQMLTESVLLALIGGLLGLALAYWGTSAIVKFAPRNIPRLDEISLDWRVALFTLATALATGVVFGLAPALASVRPDLNSVLRSTGRGNTSNLGRSRARDLLIVFEIAACVVLATGAGLLIRSFARLQHVDPGFETNHILTMELALPKARYPVSKWPSSTNNFWIASGVGLPGVNAAGVCRFLPLKFTDVSFNFHIEGQPMLSVADQPRAKFRAASGGYFSALGIHLIRGRVFNDSDGELTPKVAVINEATAKKYFPTQDPVGHRILSGNDENVWTTIVGVVANVKHAAWMPRPAPRRITTTSRFRPTPSTSPKPSCFWWSAPTPIRPR